jgi:hypothetical protein
MVNGNKGFIKRKTQSLCKVDARKQSAYKTGESGNRNGIDIRKGYSRVIYRFFYYGGNIFTVSAGCNFGNYASVNAMLVNLGGYYV